MAKPKLCNRCYGEYGSKTLIQPGTGIKIQTVLCQSCLDKLRNWVDSFLCAEV